MRINFKLARRCKTFHYSNYKVMRIIYRDLNNKFRLSRRPDERKHLIRTLLTQLITHERIKTTSAKAKHMQPTVEWVLKKARRWAVSAKPYDKKKLYSMLTTLEAREKLINVLGPRLVGQPGPFTRVKYLNNRRGDNAPVSYIEIKGKWVEK